MKEQLKRKPTINAAEPQQQKVVYQLLREGLENLHNRNTYAFHYLVQPLENTEYFCFRLCPDADVTKFGKYGKPVRIGI